MITRHLIPNVPPGSQVCGFIYEADVATERGEDMLDVVLENGILITAGWYPEGDPKGCYRVAVHRDYNELVPAAESPNADQALIDVEQFAAEFAYRNLIAVSDTTFTPPSTTHCGA